MINHRGGGDAKAFAPGDLNEVSATNLDRLVHMAEKNL